MEGSSNLLKWHNLENQDSKLENMMPEPFLFTTTILHLYFHYENLIPFHWLCIYLDNEPMIMPFLPFPDFCNKGTFVKCLPQSQFMGTNWIFAGSSQKHLGIIRMLLINLNHYYINTNTRGSILYLNTEFWAISPLSKSTWTLIIWL